MNPHLTNGNAAQPLADEAGQDSVQAHVQSGMEAIQRQFQALLESDQDIGPEQRDHMARFFEQALGEAATVGTDAGDDVFNPAVWAGTVDQLRRNGEVAADEADHLIRRLNEALAPLEKRESRLALEFSQRMARDGEAQAIAWLRQQGSEGESEAARKAGPAPATAVPLLHNEIVNSRSRRPRGPPR